MSEIKGSDPAFPKTKVVLDPLSRSAYEGPMDYGLTKREWFAGMVMQGMVGRSIQITEFGFSEKEHSVHKLIAERSVDLADTLLKTLEEKR